jgi:hypothetical protein
MSCRCYQMLDEVEYVCICMYKMNSFLLAKCNNNALSLRGPKKWVWPMTQAEYLDVGPIPSVFSYVIVVKYVLYSFGTSP